MIRAGLRLAVLYFAAWLLSTQWGDANLLYRQAVSTALQLGSANNPVWIVFSFFTVATLWHLVGLGLWVQNVPFNRRLGPTSHPFPDRPLRVQLRFRLSRLMGAFALGMFGLLLGLRALEALVPLAGSAPASWLRPSGGSEIWLTYLAAHALAAGLAWLLLTGIVRFQARRQSRPYGFVRYHQEHRPILRMLNRVLFFAHFPLAAFAASSHPHNLHLPIVAGSLMALILVAGTAQVLTLAIEIRRQRWLNDLENRAAGQFGKSATVLPDYDIWVRTLRFLHPHLDSLPAPRLTPANQPAAAARPAPPRESESPQTPSNTDPAPAMSPWRPWRPPGAAEQSPEARAAHTGDAAAGDEVAPEKPPGPEPAQDDMLGAHKVLTEGIACLERREYRHARALLQDAAVIGDRAIRDRAEALLKTIPGSRT